MITDNCTEKRFLKDVKAHRMITIRYDGVNRHIRFKRLGAYTCHFDLITWPGHLCVTGDYGTYVFSRINDMFEFFRPEKDYDYWEPHSDGKLFINPDYWGQKLLSICKLGGYKEFDKDAFKERVVTQYEEWTKYDDKEEYWIAKLWEEIDARVLSEIDNGEHAACAAIQNFDFGSFQFEGFFDDDEDYKKPTFHYIWCLYAIAWGIEQYDKAKT